MTTPGPHVRLHTLHPRLTVARADAAERARLADLLGARVVRADDLTRAAAAAAVEHSGDRAAVRARLDAAAARLAHDAGTARGKLDHLVASRQGLLDGADWARRIDAALPDHLTAVQTARDVLEARQADQRAARTGLDKVLEQRAAAAATMEEAGRHLGELVGLDLDESGLRRELEAAGQAVRAAQEAHAASAARLEALRAERAEVAQRCAALRDSLDGTAPSGTYRDDEVEAVRQALSEWSSGATFQVDPDAQALADAFTDLRADLLELQQQAAPRPDAAALEVAEAEAERAGGELERLDAQAAATVLTAEERAAIDAAHDATLQAEERLGRRVGAAAARKRVEAAREAERALLEQYGFPSYVDVVLSGGRSATDNPARFAAERTYLAALAARDGLRRAMQASPEQQYLESEHARLRAHAIDLLGVDPGDDAIALLRVHPFVPQPVVMGLRDALARAGVRPVGIGLVDAAKAWLARQAAVAADERRTLAAVDELRAEVHTLEAREAELVAEVEAAHHDAQRAAEQVELAGRTVVAYEGELSVRAGEDEQRVKRFAASEQLRAQVEALAATLTHAEQEAHAALDRATDDAAAAELTLDRALEVLSDLGRQARALAGELPIDLRPAGDALTSLSTLAERLQDHAEVLRPEIAAADKAATRAEAVVAEAVATARAAGTGAEGPRPDDVRDGLLALLRAGDDEVLLLDEPFAAIEDELRGHLLALVAQHAETCSLVLLTEQADALGWAIELPADQAAVVPASALLNLEPLGADTLSTGASVVTLPDQDNAHLDSATSARRWAGRH